MGQLGRGSGFASSRGVRRFFSVPLECLYEDDTRALDVYPESNMILCRIEIKALSITSHVYVWNLGLVSVLNSPQSSLHHNPFMISQHPQKLHEDRASDRRPQHTNPSTCARYDPKLNVNPCRRPRIPVRSKRSKLNFPPCGYCSTSCCQ